MTYSTRRIRRAVAIWCGGLALIAAGACSPGSSTGDTGTDAGGLVDYVTPIYSTGATTADILWVIDNSRSMCQEQEALRRNFEEFVSTFQRSPVDFNIAVTTTHFRTQAVTEYVAEPGRIQSLPHPPVGFGTTCKFDGPDRKGERDFTPLVRQIGAAVDCVRSSVDFPQLSQLRKWGDETITEREKKIFRCAIDDVDCADVGKDPEAFGVAQLFPCGARNGTTCDRNQLDEVYREIPLVLKADDYVDQGSLEVQRLRRDFACMSFVGTRGSPNEQGLRAAARAVSPVMTGGPAGDPFQNRTFRDRLEERDVTIQDGSNRPNHGFLREDAATAVLFITDENDCSHRGDKIQNLKSQNRCGELNCYFPTKQGRCKPSNRDESKCPLIPTQTLWKTFRDNLKASKRIDGALPSDELIVGSIHGKAQPYSGDVPDQCSNQQRTRLTNGLDVCTTGRGSAQSGDRYADFLSRAESAGQTVVPDDPNKGFMCRQNLTRPLETIAREFRTRSRRCIDRRVLPCDTQADDPECPDFQYGSGNASVCRSWAMGTASPDGYCASAIRLRMRPSGGGSVSRLPSRARQLYDALCIDATTRDGTPNRCLVDRSLYDWVPCPADESSAITLSWSSSMLTNPRRQLEPFLLEARYTASGR